ncbi:DUF2059 domain-containing protein [Vibrio sp. 99-8-1]|uniref:DUF2059 domain-containing protein n=1 Tax=Vibrio sp. 99-8-1 TaxID=2607602 RepID=UPI0014932AC2|nr:DUF2059 domain-containing protein [Vibrio sp. 99-8-1]NOI68582.1 DUF2059 domain-containing protein [Vibrio sp. 99-8-1]
MKRILMIIGLVLFSNSSLAGEREALELQVAELMGVSKLVDDIVSTSKSEIVRLNPWLAQASKEASLEPFLRFSKQKYFSAYIDAYSVYTDDELRKLLDFYRSDMGRWYLEKGIEYNEDVVERFTEVSASINDEFLEYLNKFQEAP